MATSVDIVNIGLQLLGSARITSLSDNTTAAREANAIYDLFRQSALRQHSWKFAITRARLVQSETTPIHGQRKVYPLPSNMLRLLPVDPATGVRRDWLVEGSNVLSFMSDGATALTAVRVATTTAGALASDFENGDTVDGVVLATGDRIAICGQATASENGIYVVAASGAPTRATDFDSVSEVVAGSYAAITAGSNAGSYVVLTTSDPITLETTSLTLSIRSAVPGVLDIRYVRDVTTVDDMDPLFKIVLGNTIAVQLCEKLTNSSTKLQLARANIKDAMREARRVNALETPAIPSATDPWISARESGQSSALATKGYTLDG